MSYSQWIPKSGEHTEYSAEDDDGMRFDEQASPFYSLSSLFFTLHGPIQTKSPHIIQTYP